MHEHFVKRTACAMYTNYLKAIIESESIKVFKTVETVEQIQPTENAKSKIKNRPEGHQHRIKHDAKLLGRLSELLRHLRTSARCYSVPMKGCKRLKI